MNDSFLTIVAMLCLLHVPNLAFILWYFTLGHHLLVDDKYCLDCYVINLLDMYIFSYVHEDVVNFLNKVVILEADLGLQNFI